MTKEEFIQEGYTVIDGNSKTENNKLLEFLRQNYPSVIKDGELKLDELKSLLNIPFDEKMNGYGLNFIGRNVAKAKYAKETDKALKINSQFSKDFDNTENLVLKGDNLDCLKILKSHYTGKIKCIYIDPPYNTDSENFIYPDKFNEEEREVLGLANMTEEDLERLEFSFKTKKSHNGWLSFMYPRLKLAHDLLSDDGVIFISIDDNEQANLKLLCDDIFGEDNIINNLVIESGEVFGVKATHTTKSFVKTKDFVLIYAKNINMVFDKNVLYDSTRELYDSHFNTILDKNLNKTSLIDMIKQNEDIKNLFTTYKLQISLSNINILMNISEKFKNWIYEDVSNALYADAPFSQKLPENILQEHNVGQPFLFDNKILVKTKNNSIRMFLSLKTNLHNSDDYISTYGRCSIRGDLWKGFHIDMRNVQDEGNVAWKNGKKPVRMIKQLLKWYNNNRYITILDFFAGSGTTAHAVMELNKEDGGNRKFILCQIDEPIDQKKNKGAYDFCINNNFPPVISSITCERLNRAGEKIKKELEEKESPATLDLGYKVFDLVDKPKLLLKEEQMEMFIENDKPLSPLDSIYNMIFKVGIDNPLITPDEVLKDCIYLCKTNNEKHYYITNSQQLDSQEGKDLLRKAINDGKVYIDGWTATLNTTLQQYKGKDDKDKIAIIF